MRTNQSSKCFDFLQGSRQLYLAHVLRQCSRVQGPADFTHFFGLSDCGPKEVVMRFYVLPGITCRHFNCHLSIVSRPGRHWKFIAAFLLRTRKRKRPRPFRHRMVPVSLNPSRFYSYSTPGVKDSSESGVLPPLIRRWVNSNDARICELGQAARPPLGSRNLV